MQILLRFLTDSCKLRHSYSLTYVTSGALSDLVLFTLLPNIGFWLLTVIASPLVLSFESLPACIMPHQKYFGFRSSDRPYFAKFRESFLDGCDYIYRKYASLYKNILRPFQVVVLFWSGYFSSIYTGGRAGFIIMPLFLYHPRNVTMLTAVVPSCNMILDHW